MSETGERKGRARRAGVLALNALLVILLLLLVRRGVRAAGALAEAPRRGEEMAVGAETRNRPLAGITARVVGDPAGRRVDLGGLGDAVVLVFDASCVPCAGNQWNWTGLLREGAGGATRVVALTLEPAEGAEAYWKPWPGVQVLAADTVVMRDELKLASTPVTLLVQGGVVRRAYRGPLTAPARRQVLDHLRGRGR